MKKKSLTDRVHEALCAKWHDRVKTGEMRLSEALMSASDKTLARSMVRRRGLATRAGRRSLSDNELVALARKERTHGETE